MFCVVKLDPKNEDHALGMSAYSTATEYYNRLNALDVQELTKGTEFEQSHQAAIVGNYGCAITTIAGLEGPYVAFSSLNSATHIAIFEGVVFPENTVICFKGESEEARNFKVLSVDRRNRVGTGMGYFPRYHDSEAKIMERIYDDLRNNDFPQDTQGTIHLYTYYYPCESCEYVAEQFQDSKTGFPNITVCIYYESSTSRNRVKGRVSP